MAGLPWLSAYDTFGFKSRVLEEVWGGSGPSREAVMTAGNQVRRRGGDARLGAAAARELPARRRHLRR